MRALPIPAAGSTRDGGIAPGLTPSDCSTADFGETVGVAILADRAAGTEARILIVRAAGCIVLVVDRPLIAQFTADLATERSALQVPIRAADAEIGAWTAFPG